MKRRLFLTGPIGCGKSTAIAAALGGRISLCGGFLTRRYQEPCLHFMLESPDGRIKETFLDFSAGKPSVDLAVFSHTQLLGKVLILDEIGGIELLNPVFFSALQQVLRSNVPVLGVIKGDGPAGALIETLGLTEEYQRALHRLRQLLAEDSETLVYECGPFDETARLLAEQWAEEYLHG